MLSNNYHELNHFNWFKHNYEVVSVHAYYHKDSRKHERLLKIISRMKVKIEPNINLLKDDWSIKTLTKDLTHEVE